MIEGVGGNSASFFFSYVDGSEFVLTMALICRVKKILKINFTTSISNVEVLLMFVSLSSHDDSLCHCCAHSVLNSALFHCTKNNV